MSLAVRFNLVRPGGNLIFQDLTQRLDLLNIWKTKTQLIEHLGYMLDKGHVIELTALATDHHNDEADGLPPEFYGTHQAGYAYDCWPLNSKAPGDYIDPSTHAFRQFLRDADAGPHRKQVGLGGSAKTSDNFIAAGATSFSNSNEDHVHIGLLR